VRDAIAALLFGGGGIEDARWQIVAGSLAFERAAWPLPAFASRGAFGEAWTRVRYDADSLQIVERALVGARDAARLADARFLNARELESVLRRRIAGEPAPRSRSVYELRTPVDERRLENIEDGARVQFSTPLAASDIERLARFIARSPHTEIRVHGFRRGFDAGALAQLRGLRSLILDVHRVQHSQALKDLTDLVALRFGALQMRLDVLDALPQLRALELHGTRGALLPIQRLPSLEKLTLENTAPLDFNALACAKSLRTLVLAHGEYDVTALPALTGLRRLELRALDIARLPALELIPHLEVLELQELSAVRDLRSIADAPALREVRIGGMPHLNVKDFVPLQGCADLRTVEIELGSRSKEREVYRLLKSRE
jgi:hypothetical protein